MVEASGTMEGAHYWNLEVVGSSLFTNQEKIIITIIYGGGRKNIVRMPCIKRIAIDINKIARLV